MKPRDRTTQGLYQRADRSTRHQVRSAPSIAAGASSLSHKSWLRIAQFTALVAAALVVQAVMAQTPPQPSPELMPNPAAGKKLYEAKCASCHGVDLKGSKEGPPFLHSYYVPSHHADAAFQIATRDGAKAHHWKFGDMKPVPDVSPDDVAQITAYVRYQQRRAGFK